MTSKSNIPSLLLLYALDRTERWSNFLVKNHKQSVHTIKSTEWHQLCLKSVYSWSVFATLILKCILLQLNNILGIKRSEVAVHVKMCFSDLRSMHRVGCSIKNKYVWTRHLVYIVLAVPCAVSCSVAPSQTIHSYFLIFYVGFWKQEEKWEGDRVSEEDVHEMHLC